MNEYNEEIVVDDNEVAKFIQGKLLERGIHISKDRILDVIEGYYEYLMELGLVELTEVPTH